MIEKGTILRNKKNNSFGEVFDIKDDKVFIMCHEKILGLFNSNEGLKNDTTCRIIEKHILESAINSGIIELDNSCL